ncbi:GntR family transcriptional regulator [Clostridium sp. YIM B02505]|uniref:GntR family transcriptional regulator n=1 Tax=Clostridium yunnanense TaxID=2800325 RepID=A0ABS1EQI4_9CLOT|nr:GntR family transcriptional regulator [Clostridium yunnanense]
MLNFSGNAPIYIQIVEKVKADIVSGKLKGGDKLPSVREFSETFKVNPNTVQRVFQELEREGITYSQRGIGTFIMEGDEIVKNLKTSQAEKYIQRFLSEMTDLGMSKEEISEYLLKVLEVSKNEDPRS